MDVQMPVKDAVIYIKSDFIAKRCPCCGKGEMHVIMNFGANAPPSNETLNTLKNNTLEKYISLTPNSAIFSELFL